MVKICWPLTLVLVVGLWGAWHQMQVVVLLACAAALAILHRGSTRRVFHTALGFGNRLTGAKWKDLELTAGERKSLLEQQVRVNGNLGVLLSDLDPHAFGMLYRVQREGSIEITSSNYNRAAFLRDRGLLIHDQARIRDSRSVTLTPLGEEVMARLEAESTGEPPRTGAGEASVA